MPVNPASRIAVIANDALGNFVVATPLLQMLHAQHSPQELVYFGGVRTQELELASNLINRSIPIHGVSEPLLEETGTFDLVVNIENSPLAKNLVPRLTSQGGLAVGPGSPQAEAEDIYGQLLRDEDWINEKLTDRYSFLNSGFIAEIFCRLAYLEGPIPRYLVPTAKPDRDIPDILISSSASREDKLWPKSSWIAVLEVLKKKGFKVGLLGAKPSVQKAYWKGDHAEDELVQLGLVDDLRGKLKLPEVVGALAQAKAVLSLDNGILHLAASTDTPTVGLFRHGIHRLWAPPVPNLKVLEPGPGSRVSDIQAQEALESLLLALLETPHVR